MPNLRRYGSIVSLVAFGGTVVLFAFQGLVSAQGEALPVVVTLSPASVEQDSALVRGSVVPQGSNASVWFEYGTTSALGSKTVSVVMGSGTQSREFSATLTGLLTQTTYYYRAVAVNAGGTSAGAVLLFTTGVPVVTPTPSAGEKPVVITESPSGVTHDAAVFQGRVNPKGTEAIAWFEYGLSPETLGSRVGVQSVSSTTEIAFSHSIVQLLPNTLYYYRLAAQNKIGETQGAMVSFRTLAPVVPTPQLGTPEVLTAAPTPAPFVSAPTPTPEPSPTPTPSPVLPRPIAVSGVTPAGVFGAPANLSPDLRPATRTVTLHWSAVPGAAWYSVRAVDENNAASRDSRNNCPNNPHYLCVDHWRQTSISLSVEPGHTYSWWVHAARANGQLSAPASARFSVPSSPAGELPLPPPVISELLPVGATPTPAPTPVETPTPEASPVAEPQRSFIGRYWPVVVLAIALLGYIASTFLRRRQEEEPPPPSYPPPPPMA